MTDYTALFNLASSKDVFDQRRVIPTEPACTAGAAVFIVACTDVAAPVVPVAVPVAVPAAVPVATELDHVTDFEFPSDLARTNGTPSNWAAKKTYGELPFISDDMAPIIQNTINKTILLTDAWWEDAALKLKTIFGQTPVSESGAFKNVLKQQAFFQYVTYLLLSLKLKKPEVLEYELKTAFKTQKIKDITAATFRNLIHNHYAKINNTMIDKFMEKATKAYKDHVM